jgi:hypothetical protein
MDNAEATTCGECGALVADEAKHTEWHTHGLMATVDAELQRRRTAALIAGRRE